MKVVLEHLTKRFPNRNKGGADVMVVDRDEEVIDSISGSVEYAIVADLENAEAIADLGLDRMDAAVIAIGSDLTASIMAVMICKEHGVPYVIAKAANERMGAILKKVGADKIIYPEIQTGMREARLLLSQDFLHRAGVTRSAGSPACPARNDISVAGFVPAAEYAAVSFPFRRQPVLKVSVIGVCGVDLQEGFLDEAAPAVIVHGSPGLSVSSRDFIRHGHGVSVLQGSDLSIGRSRTTPDVQFAGLDRGVLRCIRVCRVRS